MSVIRGDRMNEEVKKTVSEIVRDMKDPRISPMTTLTVCEVTKDLKYAKIKVSVYDTDDGRRASTVSALNHAAGFIARELGNRMRIRCLPSIRFSLDNSIEYSVHIAKVLDSLQVGKSEGEETTRNEGEEENDAE